MRRVYCLLFIITLIIAACSPEQSRNTRLLQAEAVCQQQPDSAILLLNGLDIDSFSTEVDKALYALVFTEAIHRIGLTFSSDSLIAFSQHYYSEQGDHERRTRAELQHAIVLYGQQHYGDAFRLLKQVEHQASQMDDPSLSYELYAVLGDINDNANNYSQTIDYYHRSLQAAQQLGNKSWMARQLNNIATTYDAMNQTDSLQAYIERCQPLLDSVEGSVRATMLTNMGSYYLHQNNLAEAKACLHASQQITYLDKTIKLLGDIAAREGLFQLAADYWSQTLQSPDVAISMDSYRLLISHYDSIAAQHPDAHRMASHLSQRLNRLYRSRYEHNDAATILDLQTQYDEQQRERHQYRTVIWLLSALVAAALAAGLLAWYYVLTHRALVQMQRQKKRQQRDNSRQLKDVTARLHKSAMLGQPAADEDVSTLQQVCFSLNPELLTLLKPLGVREQALCLLIYHHFQPSEIACLLMASPQSITNMRVKLLKRLFGETGGAKDFDQHLLSY